MERAFFAIGVPLAVAIGILGWRRRGAQAVRRPADPRQAFGKARVVFVLTIAGLLAYTVLFARANDAARAFARDASCTDDATESRATGGCRLERMAVVRAYEGGRRNAHYLIDLQSSDGATTTVEWGSRVSAATGRTSTIAGGDVAIAERFRGRIVAVRTRAVAFETADYPARRRVFDAIAALVCAGFAGVALYTLTIWKGRVAPASPRFGNGA